MTALETCQAEIRRLRTEMKEMHKQAREFAELKCNAETHEMYKQARKLAELMIEKEKDNGKLARWLISIIYKMSSGYDNEHKIAELKRIYEDENKDGRFICPETEEA